MKKLLLLLTAGATTMTQAAITEVHLYELGEADSFHSGPKFKDSISNNSFIGHGLDPILITTNNPSPISSTYAHFDLRTLRQYGIFGKQLRRELRS